MKRLIAALALAILAVPALADNIQRSTQVEQQSGYFDPSN